MKTVKKLSILLLVILASKLLSAQVSGLGIATFTYPLKNINYIYTTDDDRFPVININPSGSGTYNIAVDNTANQPIIANILDLNSGDQVLVIQMWGGIVGTHYNATVNSRTGTVLNITAVDPTSNWSLFSTSNSGDRVQIIKIPQYWDLTIDQGIVTCASWDGYTGGILCIQIKHNLIIHSGWFDVTAKGYFMQGLTLGTGGQGGIANATNNYAGCTAPYNYTICGYGTSTGVGVAPNALGENGSSSQVSGNSGTSSGGSVTLSGGVKNYKTNLVMGEPGGVPSGSKGGNGASSGSKGGNGANSIDCGSLGTNGSLGGNGKNGGNAGGGGSGGGAMVIKAHHIQFDFTSSVSPAFFANGGVGETGGLGGNGGLNGYGGIGGSACCLITPNIGLPGGNGGDGFGGAVGAEGGSGGGGGKCGRLSSNIYS